MRCRFCCSTFLLSDRCQIAMGIELRMFRIYLFLPLLLSLAAVTAGCGMRESSLGQKAGYGTVGTEAESPHESLKIGNSTAAGGAGMQENVQLTDEEMELFTSKYYSADQIREGKLTPSQYYTLEQFRYAKDYLKSKYPSHEFRFVGIHYQSQWDDHAEFDFVENGDYEAFTCEGNNGRYLHEVYIYGDTNHPVTSAVDNYYCVIAESLCEEYICNSLIDAGLPVGDVIASVSDMRGEDYSELLTVDQLLDDQDINLSCDIYLLKSDTMNDESAYQTAAGTVEDLLATTLAFHCTYTLYVVDDPAIWQTAREKWAVPSYYQYKATGSVNLQTKN